jgi:uncharacterized membrane protein
MWTPVEQAPTWAVIGLTMAKKITSTVLLFATALVMGYLSLYWMGQAHDTEGRVLAYLYLIPAVAAFGALILLPFKREKE